MTDRTIFNKVYKQLNNAQRVAVDTIDGPVMVIAGPGTGKTQVLSARIANILKLTDINPSNILALTFTESASANMRKRLVSMIGQTGYYVRIDTFHSFCMEIIKTNPDFFSLARNSESLSELEKYQLYQNIIQDNDFEVLKPINSPLFYIRDIVSAISQLKREGISEGAFGQLLKNEENDDKKIDKNLLKNQELVKIYSQYQKHLKKSGRYDFEDMISFVSDAFDKHADLLSEYQEKLTYFLVDEYQDTNNSQNQLLDRLTSFWGQQANIFVVGDPHQSIFRFQGASVENTLSFTDKYKEATIVRLTTGYRAGQKIYDGAHSVIANNQLTIDSFFDNPIKSAGLEKSEIKVTRLPSQLAEYVYVAESIAKLIKNGVSEDEIAILYRNNSDARMIRETLDKWGIVYELDRGDDVLKHESTRELMKLFTFIKKLRDGGDTSDLFEILCYQWIGIDTNIIAKVARTSGVSKIPLFDLIQLGYTNYAKMAKIDVVTPMEFHQLTKVIDLLVDFGTSDYKTTFPEWFEIVIKESGYLEWMLTQDNKVELITNISTIYEEIKRLSKANHGFKLKDFVGVIETIIYFHLELTAEDFTVVDQAVKLSTVHRAKGQEWKYVFLIHCIDGKWGNVRAHDLIKLPEVLIKNTDLSKKERNEDERRLFYVALTRAKTLLTITYPEEMVSQNQSRTVNPSMFISEIPEKLVTIDTNPLTPDDNIEFLKNLISPQKTFFFNQIDESFFRNTVDNLILSVTTLNTYLANKEDFVRNTLIKVPRAKPSYMAFGSAIHKALEEFYRYYSLKKTILNLDELLTIFKTSLAKEVITDEDYKRRLKHGNEILSGYYNTYLLNPQNPYAIEKFIGGQFRPVMLDDIPLSGRIDRIDFVDQNIGLVKVVDYKTGGAKSVGEIEATVKSAQLSEREMLLPESIRGAYKRQLLFYKLLTDLDVTFDKTVVEGEFDFVEPDKQSGKFVRRTFALEKDEVSDLKNLIRQVMKEIRSLDFLK